MALAVYAGLLALTVFGFSRLPSGFVPTQDKRYLVAFAQLPDAATLDRTTAVMKKMADIALAHPGVDGAVQFPGLSINGFVNATNAGIIFFSLKPFDERRSKELYGPAIAGGLNRKFAAIQDAFVAVFPPPPVMGLGAVGGFKMQIEDRAGLGEQELSRATQALIARGYQTPQLAGLFSSYRIDVPQLEAKVDREKAKQAGISLGDLFGTMQVYLGSAYVNDFNRFGRTYQVIVQADAPYRANADSIAQLKVRNNEGAMIPLGSVMRIEQSRGPDQQLRYDAYPSADINGGPAPGVSSGQAVAVMERLARDTLPNGIGFEWTELTYQQLLAGNTTVPVFLLCVLLVFLVLAGLSTRAGHCPPR
jgi:multidrug efflux pump subunit AcrB